MVTIKKHPQREASSKTLESEAHENCKKGVYNQLITNDDVDPLHCTMEKVFNFNRRADIYIRTLTYALVIEVTHSHDDINDLINKVSDFHNHGIIDFQMFTKEILQEYTLTNEEPTAMMKLIQSRFGGLYYYNEDDGKLHVVFYDDLKKEYVYPNTSLVIHPDIIKNIEENYQTHKCMETYCIYDYHYTELESDIGEMTREKEQLFGEINEEHITEKAELNELIDDDSFSEIDYGTEYFIKKMDSLTYKPLGIVPHPFFGDKGSEVILIELEDGSKGHINNVYKDLVEAFEEYGSVLMTAEFVEDEPTQVKDGHHCIFNITVLEE
jgi:hypothetical protein